ncbi:single-stranded DNA-binding protein [Periweissella fabaria]|uniref:Single-stranded DNA-binding protein n=1 Tax=Periweissella fabaria TaxID=546157 RepID=A0ABM8Z8I7_9LACO|nr:single-stranded DNA-binding protein [Periweissella fabaria]MCM0596262.1 single-stranded DNA-binding protein [Periweissella fabaria]CAH0417486.1 Single-stranded DNA-binding protein [Periweissella fabaria]
MINRVVLVGRLVKDVELRYTQSGKAAGNFTLAVNRQFTNQQGEREADFINAAIWGKGAENLANYTHKGSLVGVEGRIQTRNYENQQGTRVYVTEVIVENFSLLEPKSTNNNHQSQPNNNGGQNNFSASSNRPMNDPFTSGKEIDISDDDMPFR